MFTASVTTVPNAVKVSKAARVLHENGGKNSRLSFAAWGNWVTVDGEILTEVRGWPVGEPARYNIVTATGWWLRVWDGHAWISARPVPHQGGLNVTLQNEA